MSMNTREQVVGASALQQYLYGYMNIYIFSITSEDTFAKLTQYNKTKPLATKAFKSFFNLKTFNIELIHIKTTNQHILTCEKLSCFFRN